MTKRSETNADALRKELVRRERRKYVEGKDRSLAWEEVKQMAHTRKDLLSGTLDQEIALYLPLLSVRQKRVVLTLVKEFASK